MNYIYIYNPEQIKFFINDCNLNIEDFGTGNKGDAFVKFKRNDMFEKAFFLWKNKIH